MRNPIRLKNLNRRFLPAFGLAVAGLAVGEPSSTAALFGLSLAMLGLSLRSWGAGHLVKRDQSVTSGPYAHLRHPLYAGTLFVCAGFAVALGPAGWLLLAGTGVWFAAVYFPAKERRESHLLEQLHGLNYVTYRARVPALVPRFPGRSALPPDDEHWQFSRYSENNELGTLLGVVAVAGLFAVRMAAA